MTGVRREGWLVQAVRSRVGRIEVVDVAEPAGEGILVHVRSAGICGSDLHLVANGGVQCVLGHEFAGVLDDGSPVAVEPLRPCGLCVSCQRGYTNLCQKGIQRFHGVGIDGGMAERVIVHPDSLVAIPSGLDVRDACLVEPLAVVVHGLGRVSIDTVERVLVVGGGAIGLLAVATLRHAGLSVDLMVRRPAHRLAGQALGAGEPAGADYKLVVDAAGSQTSLTDAVDRARPGGTVLELGMPWTTTEIPPVWVTKEVTLVPSLLYGHQHDRIEFDEAALLLAAMPDVPGIVVRQRFELTDATDAFATAADRSEAAGKVVLHPGQMLPRDPLG